MSGEHSHPEYVGREEFVQQVQLVCNEALDDLKERLAAIDEVIVRLLQHIDEEPPPDDYPPPGGTTWYPLDRIDAGGPGLAGPTVPWRPDSGGQTVDKRGTVWSFASVTGTDQPPFQIWEYERFGRLDKTWVVASGYAEQYNVRYRLRVMTGEGWQGNQTKPRKLLITVNGEPRTVQLEWLKAIVVEWEGEETADNRIVLSIEPVPGSSDMSACWNGIELSANRPVTASML